MTGASKAERIRPKYLRDILGLEIGESVNIYPDEGDTVEALFVRLRRQAARYKNDGRRFHLTKWNDHVFVQRVPHGMGGKLAPFLQMEVGEKRECDEPFEDAREKRNLRRRLLYLVERGVFLWLERHADGELYYRCFARGEPDAPMWSEDLYDDGTDFEGATVVASCLDLASSRAELAKVGSRIRKRREEAAERATGGHD